MNSKYEQMWKNLSDSDFRKQFTDEHVDVGIAFQIRSLRNRQELTQSGLAKLLDVKQPLLSSWENPNYGKYTLKTLKDLAKAFDVGLLVRFVPFGKLIDWTVDLTSDVIAPPNFTEEQYQVQLSKFIDNIPYTDANKGSFFDTNIVGLTPSTATIEAKGALV